MGSAGRIQTLLMCAKAQERRTMLPDRFSVGYFRLGTRLPQLLLRHQLYKQLLIWTVTLCAYGDTCVVNNGHHNEPYQP